jgi:hypothetical protein
MKDSGEAIERLLAGLRDAEAPAGMERRILDRLEERAAAAQARSGWRRLRPIWPAMPTGSISARALVCGLALAGVFAIAFAIPAIRRLGHAPVHSKNAVAAVKPVRTASAVVAANVAELSPRGSNVRLGMTTNVPEAGLVRAADSDSDDSVALSEMQAASFPAPPMPLTEQERLLLRLAHKVDPVEMAMLDPKLRAMQDAEEKAEFQRFFGQSMKQAAPAQATTEQSPGDTTMEQAAPQQSTTDQAAPAQPVPEQAVPVQPAMDQATPEQPTQKQSTPEEFAPDQSTTQQATPRPTGTGENE